MFSSSVQTSALPRNGSIEALTISHLSEKSAARCFFQGLCFATTNRILSHTPLFRVDVASDICPMWIGSKLPRIKPIFIFFFINFSSLWWGLLVLCRIVVQEMKYVYNFSSSLVCFYKFITVTVIVIHFSNFLNVNLIT